MRILLAIALAAVCAPSAALAAAPRTAIFYYPWYGSPARDGGYEHWSQSGHDPPVDIASNFYPARGAYSSSNPAVLQGQMREIADCVLLFAYGFSSAFPVDVWIAKALRQLYFPKRKVSLERLQRFAALHFGPNAGYAQQYLFHYMRVKRNE